MTGPPPAALACWGCGRAIPKADRTAQGLLVELSHARVAVRRAERAFHVWLVVWLLATAAAVAEAVSTGPATTVAIVVAAVSGFGTLFAYTTLGGGLHVLRGDYRRLDTAYADAMARTRPAVDPPGFGTPPGPPDFNG
ncbi:MAG TPA: hypothetical protein VFY38_05680 [Pseudonocardia sp.]|nr:hypothetical protein [Pseudonocardia sp.]